MNTAIDIHIFHSGKEIKSFTQTCNNNIRSVVDSVGSVRASLNAFLSDLVDAERSSGVLPDATIASDDDEDEPPPGTNNSSESGENGSKRTQFHLKGSKRRKR